MRSVPAAGRTRLPDTEGNLMATKTKTTKLTKTGNPRLGSPIEVLCDDETWERVTFVAYGFGVAAPAHTMVMGVIEFDDGSRSGMLRWPDVTWRAVAGGEAST